MILLANPKKSGFTFVEIMLAMFMVGFLLTSLLGLQETVFSGVVKYASRFERLFLLKDQLFAAALARAKDPSVKNDKKEPVEKENPPTTLTYTEKKPAKQSAISKYANITVQKAQASWQIFTGEYKQVLISYIFAPDRKTKP